jgi:hypothetical protein
MAVACITKLITAVIYGFRNKLVFVTKHYTRLERLLLYRLLELVAQQETLLG